jgi:hypothetical protein
MANHESETSSIDSVTYPGRNRDGSDESIAQLETHANSLGSGINGDFSSLEQENESVSDQIIHKNTSQKRIREETFLGDKAIFKIKHKQLGKDEPIQTHIDEVCVIAEHGQEPELVPKSMPGPDQEPFRDIKSERGPGQKRDRET